MASEFADLDTADLTRIDRYGQGAECSCDIPFERLKVERQTERCVACKGRWERPQPRPDPGDAQSRRKTRISMKKAQTAAGSGFYFFV
jgi:RNA polymerase-binding transcription factor DksA